MMVKDVLIKMFGFGRIGAGGNVAITTALTMVPILCAAGGALDYTRAISVRTHLQATLDAGLLAIARDYASLQQSGGSSGSGQSSGENISERILPFIVSSGLSREIVDTVEVEVNLIDGGIAATARADVPTSLLRLIHVENLPIVATAEVMAAAEPMEIALALDVTGSMAANMADMRSAAQGFVDLVTSNGTNPAAKVALVPFVGAVNIGTSPSQSAWLDTIAKRSKHNAHNLQGIYIARRANPGCPPLPGEGGVKGGGESGWLDMPEIKTVITALVDFLLPAAHAATPYTVVEIGACDYANPSNVNNSTLYELLPEVTWKGCVEARPEPYDVNDTPPGTNKNTLWAKYFWPDGLDPGDVWFPEGANNYMSDEPFDAPGSNLSTNGWGRHFSVLKYRPGKTLNIVETPPATRGPNRACPEPILPLTNDYAALTSSIAALRHYQGSGTVTAEGVAWGWRVLSPGVPFTEGAPYGEVRKVLVLMSDGGNNLDPEEFRMHGSDKAIAPSGTHYSSYGSLVYGRFPDGWDADVANQYLDQRMSLACTNAKEAGIEIYVIAFGVAEASGRQLLSNCATSPSHMVEIDRNGSLSFAFDTIASKMSKLRLTR